jgi:hypothetical protein
MSLICELNNPTGISFFKEPMSHIRRQLGYVMNTRTMLILIPDDMHVSLVSELVDNLGPTSGRQFFMLSEAAELLGVLVSLCRVCLWGIFLFQNLYHAMAQNPLPQRSLSVESARVYQAHRGA